MDRLDVLRLILLWLLSTTLCIAEPISVRDLLSSETEIDGRGMQAIPAELIVEAAKAGKNIDISNAVIADTFSLQSNDINSAISFTHCTFLGKVVVRNTSFAKGISFPSCIFKSQVEFTGCVIGKNLDFTDCDFLLSAAFFSTEVEGVSYFGNNTKTLQKPARFEGDVNFQHFKADDSLEMQQVTFDNDADFNGTHVKGTMFFNEAKFHKKWDFSSTQIDLGFDATDATVGGEGDLSGAKFSSFCYLLGATFRKTLNLQGSDINYLIIDSESRDDPIKLCGTIDLRDCVYQNIRGDWTLILVLRPGYTKLPVYDRQVYVELETVLRKQGLEQNADDVYLERRFVEKNIKWMSGDYLGAVGDSVYQFVANYGVRPYRLFYASVVLLLFGTEFYTCRGSVVAIDKPTSNRSKKLTRSEAFFVALNQFLPSKLLRGSKWQPSDRPISMNLRIGQWSFWLPEIRGTTLASVMQVGGWVLIPLGIAAITGLLHYTG